jgi:hypothetical protein
VKEIDFSFLNSKVQDSGRVCRGKNPKMHILIDMKSLGCLKPDGEKPETNPEIRIM